MSGIPWVRDEIILGLDVCLSFNGRPIADNSQEIVDLSQLLNKLNLIPTSKRDKAFRNCAGVGSTLRKYRTMMKDPEQPYPVGKLFMDVFYEYEGDYSQVEKIAASIRRNYHIVNDYDFLISNGDCAFKEGMILSTIHNFFDKEMRPKTTDKQCCDICGINPTQIYNVNEASHFFESHCCINPIDFVPSLTASQSDYITVCPNCHKILHAFRPWVTKDTINVLFE